MSKRISQLDLASPVSGAEMFAIVQNSRTKRLFLDDLKTYTEQPCASTLVSRGNTVGTGADTIEKFFQTYQMDANTLSTDGSWLEIFAWGSTGATNDGKTIKIRLGSTVVYNDSALPANNKKWDLTCKIMRTSQTTQKVVTFNAVFDSGTSFTSEPTEDLATQLAISISGTNAAANLNDLTCEGFIIRLNSVDPNS